MNHRFYVVGIRKSAGTHTDEGVYDSVGAAMSRLDALGEDSDCLLAEVEQWAKVNGSGTYQLDPIYILAQADRSTGKWRNVEGELRPRSRGREAEKVLRSLTSLTVAVS